MQGKYEKIYHYEKSQIKGEIWYMLFSLMKYEKKIIMKKQISFYLIHYFFTHESQFFSA